MERVYTWHFYFLIDCNLIAIRLRGFCGSQTHMYWHRFVLLVMICVTRIPSLYKQDFVSILEDANDNFQELKHFLHESDFSFLNYWNIRVLCFHISVVIENNIVIGIKTLLMVSFLLKDFGNSGIIGILEYIDLLWENSGHVSRPWLYKQRLCAVCFKTMNLFTCMMNGYG